MSGCASNPLPNRQAPSILGVNQNHSKSDVFPEEYVFCDIEKGAWRCPQVSAKTAITRDVVADESESLEAIDYTSVTDLDKNFTYSDLVGEPLGKAHFAFDSHYLTEYSRGILRNLLPKLIGKPVLLLGFTDNIGTELYNDDLAFNRAKAVKQFFVDNGKSGDEIHIEGNGQCCFLVPNGTDDQRQINRRVEIYYAD